MLRIKSALKQLNEEGLKNLERWIEDKKPLNFAGDVVCFKSKSFCPMVAALPREMRDRVCNAGLDCGAELVKCWTELGITDFDATKNNFYVELKKHNNYSLLSIIRELLAERV